MTASRTSAAASAARRSHDLIPGGAHTYAKGDDQYPVNAPAFIERGQGCRVWDPDGNEYIEYGMGLRAVTLGHAYPAVVERVRSVLDLGVNFTRPSPMEVEAAEALLDLLRPGQMVKFCKNGSDATSAGTRLARAVTGRDLIASCRSHPFFSTDDWFMATSAMNAGIPKAIQDLTVGFDYGDIADLERVFAEHPGEIACVVMEAAREHEPPQGYLQAVQELCRRHGAVWLLDEMITGFRWHNGGAQAEYGIEPDLSAFGKGMGNGFSVSALVGRADLMRRGGLDTAEERVFLLSTTHGAELVGLAAAIATIETYRQEPVIEHMHRQGRRLADGVHDVVDALGILEFLHTSGRASNLVYRTLDPQHQPSQPYRTLFMQELIDNGVLGPSFVVSHSHSDVDIDRTIAAVEAAATVYARALEDGPEGFLRGRSIKPAIRRYA
jgi:glutamate-1-semialdehyde 2,1-aminomutase